MADKCETVEWCGETMADKCETVEWCGETMADKCETVEWCGGQNFFSAPGPSIQAETFYEGQLVNPSRVVEVVMDMSDLTIDTTSAVTDVAERTYTNLQPTPFEDLGSVSAADFTTVKVSDESCYTGVQHLLDKRTNNVSKLKVSAISKALKLTSKRKSLKIPLLKFKLKTCASLRNKNYGKWNSRKLLSKTARKLKIKSLQTFHNKETRSKLRKYVKHSRFGHKSVEPVYEFLNGNQVTLENIRTVVSQEDDISNDNSFSNIYDAALSSTATEGESAESESQHATVTSKTVLPTIDKLFARVCSFCTSVGFFVHINVVNVNTIIQLFHM